MKIHHKMKLFKIFLLSLIVISCSDKVEPMDDWESEVADSIKADRVDLYHLSTTTTTDGQSSGEESYLELAIYNSKTLNSIKDDNRLYSQKCDSIVNNILGSSVVDIYPEFREIRMKIVENNGFSIFGYYNTTTITFKVDK
ncbi:hypothetical protein [Solirubrum puertoriconensis]|uniref:hypothetical protein n=1 Tax=Solirubrum puertoriconensis TaxID=1751427 RepID=UPI00073F625C|nr:hypothetical protein [Solirubrum puertoriconensis]